MCSFSRSGSHWPGMTLSPVNFTLSASYAHARFPVRVHVHAAWEMQISVNQPALFRLQCDRIINPVANFKCFQRTVGHRRRKRKVRGIEFRQMQFKIYGVNIARTEGGKLYFFKCRVCAGKLNAQMILDEESNNRHGYLGMRLHTDPDQDCPALRKQSQIISTLAEDGYSKNFRILIAIAEIDIGDVLDNFG